MADRDNLTKGQPAETGQQPSPEARPDDEAMRPTGLTLRESRRRLVVTGLSGPALLSLPSRRVWATACTKSKLLSGNLSAQQTTQSCVLGCQKGFWQSNTWPSANDFPVLAGAAQPGDSFVATLNLGGIANGQGNGLFEGMYDPDLQDALDGIDASQLAGDFGEDSTVRDRIRRLFKHATAAFLNAQYLNAMFPGVGFSLTTAQVESGLKIALADIVTAMGETPPDTSGAATIANDLKIDFKEHNRDSPMGGFKDCPYA